MARYAALRLAALPPGAPVLKALASGQPREVPDVMAAVGRLLPAGAASEVLTALALAGRRKAVPARAPAPRRRR